MYCAGNQPHLNDEMQSGVLTAQLRPRKSPFMPSFLYITLTPCRTPLYNRGASFRDCSSPCNCNRILTVSKECVTVTAPHAAMPPAMKDPMVVDMAERDLHQLLSSTRSYSTRDKLPFLCNLVLLLQIHTGQLECVIRLIQCYKFARVRDVLRTPNMK